MYVSQCVHVCVRVYVCVLEPVESGVKCPFQDAFNFTYSDAGSEYCSQMESYAKPCVSQTRYRLLFRHCTGSAEYHDRGNNVSTTSAIFSRICFK